MKRKICVVTGSMAEYGLLRGLIQGIKESPALQLQVVVTGMHLSPEYGLSYKNILRDGFNIDRSVEMLTSSDTAVGITKSMGLGLIGFADVFHELKPHVIVVLGDRFEIFCAVSAAMVAQIPVAHLHGGESTEGLIDEAIRHSITKMAQLHFVAADEYRGRVIQLGESPERVFRVGGFGVDAIDSIKRLTQDELEHFLGCKLFEKNLLVTFHPVTLDTASSEYQFNELLTALRPLKDTRLLFTRPNADTEGRRLALLLDHFVKENHNAVAFNSLGQLAYISAIDLVDGVIGNSSSGLIEVPTFKKATINIGDRQRGRLQARSVIQCEPNAASISSALARMYSKSFQESLETVTNPYGVGGATAQTLMVLESIPLDGIIKKKFYDLGVTCG